MTLHDSPFDALQEPARFGALVGYRLIAWQPDRAELELVLAERHLNRSGVMHGGVLTTLVDAACGYAGTHCTVPGNVRRALTLQLSTQFVDAGRCGEVLTARARKVGGGRTVFFAETEVRTADGRTVGRGEGVFRYFRGSQSPEGVPAETLTATDPTSRRG